MPTGKQILLGRTLEELTDLVTSLGMPRFTGKQIAQVADAIARRYREDGVRIVLISGPSSSGKTTFCKRLQVQLVTNLLHPLGISLDDYYVNREDTPRDDDGAYDFESLYAIDLPYFHRDLERLLRGDEIELPSFDFSSGRRVFRGDMLQIRDNSVLILEGIHGLNPELTAHIPPERIYRIYVSALTTISLDGHNWIPTSDNRLLRRIVRDYHYRGYSPPQHPPRRQACLFIQHTLACGEQPLY